MSPSESLRKLALGLLMLPLVAAPAGATDPPAPAAIEAPPAVDSNERLPALTLDRADSNSGVWHLADHVVVRDAPPPDAPRPVYLQFGFVGCAPCERLAEVANDALPTDVVKVYIHLDDVLAAEYPSMPALWRTLYEQTRTGPYAEFIPIRRGHSALMRQLAGEGAAPPSAVLVLPSGEIYARMRSPTAEDASSAFAEFAASLDATRSQDSTTESSR